MDTATTTVSLVQTLDTAPARSRSLKKKRSLPDLLVPLRRKSTRSLKNPSPPQTAALDRAFVSKSNPSSPTLGSQPQDVPPVPQRKPSVIQSRIVEARKKRDEQYKNLVDVDRIVARGTSPGGNSLRDASPRPSMSKTRRLRAQTSNEHFLSRPQDILTARPSYESHLRGPPPTATFSKPNPIYPSQGELESFDFKIPQRPRTANLSPVHSPKHESVPTITTGTQRPRQVSDADSSWQRSPKMSDHDWTPPWAALYDRDQRGSGASGFSSGSSTLDTTRSSVFTKTSVLSERTEDFDESEYNTDDILDMYYAGKDDSLHAIRESADDQENARIRRRSMMIAQAVESSIDDAMSRQSSQQTGSSLVISESAPADDTEPRLDHQQEHRPPKLQVKSTAHDQYGFRKESREVTLTDYDAWWSEYSPSQKHRTSRWKEFLKSDGLQTEDPRCFPEPSGKVRRFIQKGIPPAWRGNAWFFYAGGHEYLDAYPGRYQDLLCQAQEGKLSRTDKESIERDLHRTFPDNIHFKPDQEPPNVPPNPNDPYGREETPILSALRRVLSAFAIDHPRIGYCQSLNFLAGMLLLFLPEERAFWLLHIITVDLLPGTHETSLEGANIDLWVLMLAIRDTQPQVWTKLGAMPSESNLAAPTEMWEPNSIRLPPISLCTTSWFMSLFIGTLPTETVLRVWDLLFYDGAKTLFRTALAIFKAGETDIKAIQDSMEIFQVVQQLPRKMIRCNELLIRVTASGKGSVSGTWLEKQRAVRKAFFAKERGVEVARKMSKVSRKDGVSSRKQSKAEGTGEEIEANPALGEVPKFERVTTRKASGWFVKRTQTVRKTTNPAA